MRRRSMERQQTKLGLIGLTAIVVGGTIGGGIFNISKVLAEQASLGAILISWAISSVGILGIALTFKTLNVVRPDLSSQIYMYARTGFGKYAGFNIAWSYWVGTAIGNVVLSVMLNDAFGIFFPILLQHDWATFIFASCFTWAFTLLVSSGIKLATAINTISTIIKFSSLLLIIVLLFIFVNYDLMHIDFWGKKSQLGPLSEQINSTMLTTLFFFMGIEGAVIVSARARFQHDVGKATIIGYLICLVLNIIVCTLSFGFIDRSQMTQLNDPALAQILGKGVGEWARLFVNISVIIAVAGAWLVSTIISAELPADAAHDHMMPHFFIHRNKRGTPIHALLITAIFMQVVLFFVLQAQNVYLFTVHLSGIMIIPTYIVSGMFLTKIALKKSIYADQPTARQVAIIIGTAAILYCLWVIYASNIHLLLLSSGVYIIGIFFYWLSQHKILTPRERLFTTADHYLIGLLVIALVFSLFFGGKYL